MNFEFPLKELPAVMRGPRMERRRVLVGGSACWGSIVEEGAQQGQLRLDDGRVVDLATVQHLPPVSPSKIIAVHISYSSRSFETRNQPRPTETPTYFTKPPTSVNGHGCEIHKPADSLYLNYEGEYAIVIGKTCRNVLPDEAWDYIEGFCPALDMGLQNYRDTDQGSMLRVKGADTLLPIGPGIVRGVNLFAQTLRTTVNGRVVQEGRAPDLAIAAGAAGVQQEATGDPVDEAALLADATKPADEQLPSTGVSLEIERLLGSVFIASPTYGTRASTLLFVHADGRRRLIERSFAAQGVPAGEVRVEV